MQKMQPLIPGAPPAPEGRDAQTQVAALGDPWSELGEVSDTKAT